MIALSLLCPLSGACMALAAAAFTSDAPTQAPMQMTEAVEPGFDPGTATQPGAATTPPLMQTPGMNVPDAFAPFGTEGCGLDTAQTWVGTTWDKGMADGVNAGRVRVLTPGAAATMDHSPNRLNVLLDTNGRVVDVHCG